MRYVIIGNGIAGISAAQVIRGRDATATITIIGDESRFFYSRTALMWAYTGQLSRRDMEPYERRYWTEQRFECLFDTVMGIDCTSQRLSLKSGATITYDRLLLATGSVSNLFGWPGQDLEGVSTFTTMHDLERLMSLRSGVRQAVVVGGGLVGIELVEIFLHDGFDVTYLIREPWYFNLALSQQEADLVHRRLVDHGCTVIYNDEIGEISGQSGRVSSVITKAGKTLPCQLLGIAVGVHPRIDLAKTSGVSCGRGIIVDHSFRTSTPNVWAVGDCAEIRETGQERGLVQALWYTANRQGLQAGRSMVGDTVLYDPGLPYNSAQFLFLDFVTVGWTKLMKSDLEESQWIDESTEHGVRISHDQAGIVHGLSMIGPRYRAKILKKWIEERRTVDEVMTHLAAASFGEEFARVRVRVGSSRKGLASCPK